MMLRSDRLLAVVLIVAVTQLFLDLLKLLPKLMKEIHLGQTTDELC